MKKYLLVLISLVGFQFASNAQSFIQAYADIANQCSQTNVTNNLTEFEGLGVKRRGTATAR